MRIATRFAPLAIALGLSGRAATAPEHVSILEGAANFRDIGGYPTADDRHVRRGSV